MSGYTYDTGMLIAAERNDRIVWAVHRRLLEQGISPSVPTTVLAQAWRGGPQALLSRLLAGCEVRSFTEDQARECGRLLARNSSSDVVDASGDRCAPARRYCPDERPRRLEQAVRSIR
jgi:hypothetical protein